MQRWYRPWKPARILSHSAATPFDPLDCMEVYPVTTNLGFKSKTMPISSPLKKLSSMDMSDTEFDFTATVRSEGTNDRRRSSDFMESPDGDALCVQSAYLRDHTAPVRTSLPPLRSCIDSPLSTGTSYVLPPLKRLRNDGY